MKRMGWMFLIFVVVAIGCGVDPPKSDFPVQTVPEVSSTTPADGATDVAPNTAIAVNFTGSLDASGVSGNVTVSANGTNIDGMVGVSGYTAAFTPTNLLPYETLITVKISMSLDDGENIQTSEYSFSFTTSTAPDTQAPSAPLNVKATAVSSSEISVSWNASTDNVAVVGYKVYRDGVSLKVVSQTATADTGLTASTQYCYAVSAYDAAGNESAQSAQACGTTLSIQPPDDTTAPSVPVGLSATVISANEIDLDWNASTDNVAVIGYKVYRDGVSLKAVSQTVTADTGLTASTQYCYAVSAYDAAGNESGQSGEVCGTTQADPNLWTLPTHAHIRSSVVDGSGNLYVGGVTSGAFSGFTNAGSYDVFLAKFNSDGTLAWVRQKGTVNEDGTLSSSIAHNGSEVFLFWGEIGQGRSYITSFKENGDENVTFSAQYANSITADGAGVYVATSFGELKKLDKTTGTILWIWSAHYGVASGFSNIFLANGYVYVVGSGGSGVANLVFAKVGTDGTEVWSRQWGTTGQEMGYAITVSSSTVYVGGMTGFMGDGTTHYVFLGYDLSGNYLWENDATQFGANPMNMTTDGTSVWAVGYVALVELSATGTIQNFVSGQMRSLALYGNTLFITDDSNIISRYNKDTLQKL